MSVERFITEFAKQYRFRLIFDDEPIIATYLFENGFCFVTWEFTKRHSIFDKIRYLTIHDDSNVSDYRRVSQVMLESDCSSSVFATIQEFGYRFFQNDMKIFPAFEIVNDKYPAGFVSIDLNWDDDHETHTIVDISAHFSVHHLMHLFMITPVDNRIAFLLQCRRSYKRRKTSPPVVRSFFRHPLFDENLLKKVFHLM